MGAKSKYDPIQAMQEAMQYVRRESEKKSAEEKKAGAGERAVKRLELQKKRRETELKKLSKLMEDTVDYIEQNPDYIIYHKANDHILVFKKISFVMKKELPDNEVRFQPREWHEDKTMWKVFIITFITGAKVNRALADVTSFSIKSKESIVRVLYEIGK